MLQQTPNHLSIDTIPLHKNPLSSCSNTISNTFSIYSLILFPVLHIDHSAHLFNIVVVNKAARTKVMAKILDTGQKNSETILKTG